MNLYSLISCILMSNRFTQKCDCFESHGDNYFHFLDKDKRQNRRPYHEHISMKKRELCLVIIS